MTKVLITGATGNVGTAVIQALSFLRHDLEIFACVRTTNEAQLKFSDQKVKFIEFDFMNLDSYKPALANCDLLFLLRPPQISDVNKYFEPLIAASLKAGVKHIVFLSVQGVEKSKIIPHHKIEKLIVASRIPYTFLRPAYFMQNFTTTLRPDLIKRKLIYLPAGNAKFTLIDIRDIGTVAANILTNISEHINKSYELTSNDCLTFSQMAIALSNVLGINIRFQSPNLIRFFMTKRSEAMPTMQILVMIMLHYFPRFQKEPATSKWVEKLTGRQPISFDKFVNDNKELLE